MSDDVLTKEQFEREWRTREVALTAPAPRVRAAVRKNPSNNTHADSQVLLGAIVRPLFAAALEALLDFETVVEPPRRRRIRRK